MSDLNSSCCIQLPSWVSKHVKLGDALVTEKARMAMAIALSEGQVIEGTGGPFGALICDIGSGEVLGIGVNRVTATCLSSAHAECVAWSMAQQHLATHDLSGRPVALYSSAQPCIGCWGGLFWTGVVRLVYGATKKDVEIIAGFDEGPVPRDWKKRLQQQGISVEGPQMRSEAQRVLQAYRDQGGVIYNPGNRPSL